MTDYADLVAEARELTTWEGADNPLTEVTRRLMDAVERLQQGQGTGRATEVAELGTGWSRRAGIVS